MRGVGVLGNRTQFWIQWIQLTGFCDLSVSGSCHLPKVCSVYQYLQITFEAPAIATSSCFRKSSDFWSTHSLVRHICVFYRRAPRARKVLRDQTPPWFPKKCSPTSTGGLWWYRMAYWARARGVLPPPRRSVSPAVTIMSHCCKTSHNRARWSEMRPSSTKMCEFTPSRICFVFVFWM